MKVFKSILIFGSGALVGVFGTYKYFKKKYEKIADEEIESIKKVYTFKRPENNEDSEESNESNENEIQTPSSSFDGKLGSTTVDSITHPKPDELMDVYKNLINEHKYAKAYENSTEDDSRFFEYEPYVISPDEYGEEYETACLTYYSDGILEDDIDNAMIEDPKALVGDDYFNHFGSYNEEDIVYVRNEETQTDYEICRDHRTYAEAHKLDNV